MSRHVSNILSGQNQTLKNSLRLQSQIHCFTTEGLKPWPGLVLFLKMSSRSLNELVFTKLLKLKNKITIKVHGSQNTFY